MLVHPLRQQELLQTQPGTRHLVEDFGLPGLQFAESKEEGRTWTLHSVYAPIAGRSLTGIRVKLIDNKQFLTFMNQRDLEVLLGLGVPGRPCVWTGEDYPEPGSINWYGLCADEDDLRDDLYDTEIVLRSQMEWVLPAGIEITRRVHLDEHHDVEELMTLLWDRDAETGISPDPRFETLRNRWTRVERRRVRWATIY